MKNNLLIQEIRRNKDLIYYDRSKIINENSYYPTYNYQPVFTDVVTQDGRYAVILDELYDLHSKELIGNIWEDISRLKIFLNHLFESAENLTKDLKESFKGLVNNFLITESKGNIKLFREQFKLVLEQESGGAWDSFTTWAKDSLDSAKKGVSDFVKTSYEGTKKLISGITESDWKKVLDILGKGVLYTARSIRSLLSHPVGVVLDAVLVASGIGKGVVAVPWAIAVGLDLYEILTGNYEESGKTIFGGLLQLLFDSIGLLLAGAAAKAFKMSVSPLMKARNSKEILTFLQSNPAVRKTLVEALQTTKGLQKKLLEIVKLIKTKNTTIGTWLEGIVLQFDYIMRKFSNDLTKLGFKTIDPKKSPIDNMLSAFVISSGVAGGIGTASTAMGKYKSKKMEDEILNATENVPMVTPEDTEQWTNMSNEENK